jgi:cell division transport system ATP-binding protein
MPKIELEKVTKTYRNKLEKRTEVGVENVDLTIQQGEFVFVIGSSGSGKSTLLQLMTGHLRPTRGRVAVGGRDLQWLLGWSKNRAAMMFGQVWQDQMLVKRQTVEENLKMVAHVGALRRESAKELDRRIRKVLALVGMSGVEQRYPLELSIGEYRRVELARAMLHSPPILVLDELTANLDDDCIWDIFQLLQELNSKGTTIIMATHASQYVNILRRRVITMVDGHIFSDVQKGRYGETVRRTPPYQPQGPEQ